MKNFMFMVLVAMQILVGGTILAKGLPTSPRPTPTQPTVDSLADSKGHLLTDNRRRGAMITPKKPRKKKPAKKPKVKFTYKHTTIHQVKPGLWIDY